MQSFKGYKRTNGDAATRNEIWIIPTAGELNNTAAHLASMLQKETGGAGIDTIVAFRFSTNLHQLLQHPNAGAMLLVGLGQEGTGKEALVKALGEYDPRRIRLLEIRKADDEIATGMQMLREMHQITSQDQRTDIPLGELKIGITHAEQDKASAAMHLAFGGCHLIVSITTEGTPFGTFVPTLKISTTTNLYIRKPCWIDFNAGSLLEGEKEETLRERLLRYLIEVAGGMRTNNEKSGYRETAAL